MKNIFIYPIVIMFVFASMHVYGQSNHLWLRTTFSVKDSLGITYDAELQYRLQNSNENAFPSKNILNSARIWMHNVSNKKLKISVSPIAFFEHIQYKNEDQPSEKYQLREYRNSLATEYHFFENELVDFYVRTAFEGRFLFQQKKSITMDKSYGDGS